MTSTDSNPSFPPRGYPRSRPAQYIILRIQSKTESAKNVIRPANAFHPLKKPVKYSILIALCSGFGPGQGRTSRGVSGAL